jgi:hypothetical protein
MSDKKNRPKLSPEDLPPLPDLIFDEGYAWLGALRHGWYDVSSWGRDGWDLGSWPLVIVAHYDGEDRYGLAVYVEGDVEVTACPNREERDGATDQVAAFYWRRRSDRPDDLPAEGEELLPHHRGPYSPDRHA